MKDIVDMHVHTSASDGIFSPAEIVGWAKKLGLKGVAITDHDTVDGIKEAVKASEKYDDFLVIPGIEFSTLYNKVEIHILGYFIDYKHPDMIRITEKIKNYRSKRAALIINKLIKLDYDLNVSEVKALSKEGAIGRPHIARLLVKKGYVSSVQEAFEKLLQKGKPAYVERFKLTVDEAIHIIKKSKGIPVLAHPGLIAAGVDIEQIIQKGIKGIEVYHSKHSKVHNKIYLELAKKYNLFVTGGSDYHDEMVDGIPAIGRVFVSYDLVKEMKKYFFEGF
ncbi:PHP domain-containing protein [Crassaminicella indica]|uniref:PHP domain-containing protein n=1 Tax=Crassaminicella indica TaxID=2855394 RepID=A0ABX8RC97_9CLOT|nr:PHP domain-containing protein [Crassaminicella indica]QXM06084.1 PHP domain-containing protein [Crassaminicella indica]